MNFSILQPKWDATCQHRIYEKFIIIVELLKRSNFNTVDGRKTAVHMLRQDFIGWSNQEFEKLEKTSFSE